jgi:hypothetical protein
MARIWNASDLVADVGTVGLALALTRAGCGASDAGGVGCSAC